MPPPSRSEPSPSALAALPTAVVRRSVSVVLSTATIAAALGVLAVTLFLPEVDPTQVNGAAVLLRFHERTSSGWIAPPIIALILTLGLPRRADLNALPGVLGIVAIGLVLLSDLLPGFAAAVPPLA